MLRSLCLVFSMAGLLSCSPDPGPRQIAITLDDAPIVKPLSYPGEWERQQAVDSLISVLDKHAAAATVFAIAGDLETPEARALLARWTEAGISVANHSVTHRSFNELSLEEGAREIAQAQAVLSRSVDPAHVVRYFRFPYLERGRSLDERDQWMAVLDSLALKVAPVTVTNDDWRFDNDYADAELAEDWDRRFQVGQAYVEHIKESVRHWDGLAQEMYGRNVPHVLLLHANRVNRDYLDTILGWLSAEGFEFVTLAEAYEDPMYREETTWLGSSGVSLLEQIKQTRMAEGSYTAR
ncbi:MAG: polysaccharide deacetylase family protein [Rhodothermales bacterium]|nr:polysaccharide deacetylase family protein [Rhodothermales bacterium]